MMITSKMWPLEHQQGFPLIWPGDLIFFFGGGGGVGGGGGGGGVVTAMRKIFIKPNQW